jgi:uncharacterized protein (DUF1697 family)
VALVALLKGLNVGGHRSFRPSILANQLKRFDIVNVGAAGTLVIRKSVPRATLRSEIIRRLPFEAEVMICSGSDILRLKARDPFAGQPVRPDIIHFVSVLSKRRQPSTPIPLDIPTDGKWCVRILGRQDQFVYGLYRREMKAIRYLGELENVFGAAVTTRNWNTILSIARILEGD